MYDPLEYDGLKAFVSRRLPIFGEATAQLGRNMQLPYELSITAALAAISTACQFLVDVRTPRGQQIPVGLFLLLLAMSGERKTSALRRMMKAIYAFDEVMYAEFMGLYDAYIADQEDWREEKRLLQRRIRKAKTTGEDCTLLNEEMADLLNEKPDSPICFQLVNEDVSAPALLEVVSQTGGGALITSEGGILLEGKTLQCAPYLNSGWSADHITVRRGNKPSLRIRNPRLTICIMLQPTVFEPLAGKKGEKIRGSGFFARFVVFNPPTMQGARLSHDEAASWDKIEQFDARMIELLDQLGNKVRSGDRKKEVIGFSNDAADFLVAHANTIERQIAAGGKYQNAPDHASKLAENITRMAGLLHFFEGMDGPISIDTVKVAVELCEISSRDYMDLFSRPPEEIQDAMALDEMLNVYRREGRSLVLKNYVRQRCPNQLRLNGRFYRALDVLVRNRSVLVYQDLKKQQVIDLNPHFVSK